MKKLGVILVILLSISLAYSSLYVTNNHPFLVNSSWIEASELKVGDYLTSIDGKKVRITSIQDIKETKEVFNFETLFHNYIVNNIIVHNSQAKGLVKKTDISCASSSEACGNLQGQIEPGKIMSFDSKAYYILTEPTKDRLVDVLKVEVMDAVNYNNLDYMVSKISGNSAVLFKLGSGVQEITVSLSDLFDAILISYSEATLDSFRYTISIDEIADGFSNSFFDYIPSTAFKDFKYVSGESGKIILIISDLHGNTANLLKINSVLKSLKQMEKVPDEIWILGDIDPTPENKILQAILALKNSNPNIRFRLYAGNHDVAILKNIPLQNTLTEKNNGMSFSDVRDNFEFLSTVDQSFFHSFSENYGDIIVIPGTKYKMAVTHAGIFDGIQKSTLKGTDMLWSRLVARRNPGQSDEAFAQKEEVARATLENTFEEMKANGIQVLVRGHDHTNIVFQQVGDEIVQISGDTKVDISKGPIIINTPALGSEVGGFNLLDFSKTADCKGTFEAFRTSLRKLNL